MTDKKYVWAAEEIYDSVEKWEKDYKEVLSKIDFSEFKGKLGDKKVFLACMKKQEELGRVIEKLGLFAMMKHDEDTRDSVYDALLSKIETVSAVYGDKTAYILPELTSLDESVLESYIRDPELSAYDYSLKLILKDKAHVLSEGEESGLIC